MISTLIMNTLGPFIVWKTQKLPANVKFEKIDNDTFIEDRSDEYKLFVKELEALNFNCIGSSVLSDTNSNTFFRLYWNEQTKTAATCVSGVNDLGEVCYIEFSQKYSDGSMLDVSNNPVVEVYPKLNIKRTYRFPDISKAGELLDIFNKLKGSVNSSLIPMDFDVEKCFEEIETFMRLESDELTQKGITKPDIDEEGKRALTLYGAIYLTYHAIPPGKNIFGYFDEKRSKNALGRL